MTEFQAKTCKLIERLPEEKTRLIFSLLFQTALSGDDFKDDMDYFNSIPGYVDSLMSASDTPLSDCVEDIGWDIP